MSLMAFVDANSAGGDGGIMLDIEAKGEDDMETIIAAAKHISHLMCDNEEVERLDNIKKTCT